MKIRAVSGWAVGRRIWTGALCIALAAAAAAQQAAPSTTPGSSAPRQSAQSGTHITADQAKELFALVDQLIQFSSTETGLPVKSTVKRQLTTRTAVESYLQKKFDNDEDSKRLQRDEIVLKKFGLLDRDFELKPFLLALLKEQIEAYYDTKTKTVNMLDWIDVDEQKPVLAHELTHALQDQHSDLEKWDDQTPNDVSTDAAGDNDHLARDEMDTARDAVAEGQATAVMMDYMLKPLGKSIVGNPELMDVIRSQMSGTEDSPVMARAPLLLSESMLFPYREGLSFEQDIWMDQGQQAAFSGALDRPPTSTWEITNPRQYEKKNMPSVPLLPNIHPLVDAQYKPYDIGQVGQLDVDILSQLFGGESASRDLTPAWNGGLYWAGQLRSAKTPAEQAGTKSLAFFYLSVWRNEASAAAFEQLYARSLVRKYSRVQPAANPVAAASDGTVEEVYTTDEGPVILTRRGSMVFVSESFPQELARKLAALILDAQGAGEMRMASAGCGEVLNGQAESPALNRQTEESPTLNGQTDESTALKRQTESPALNGQTEKSPALNGQTEESPTLKGQTEESPTLNGQTKESPALNGQTKESPALKRQTEENPVLKGHGFSRADNDNKTSGALAPGGCSSPDRLAAAGAGAAPADSLSSSFVRFFAESGVMKSAVDAALRTRDHLAR